VRGCVVCGVCTWEGAIVVCVVCGVCVYVGRWGRGVLCVRGVWAMCVCVYVGRWDRCMRCVLDVWGVYVGRCDRGVRGVRGMWCVCASVEFVCRRIVLQCVLVCVCEGGSSRVPTNINNNM